MTENDLKKLLSNTEPFMNHVYWIQQNFYIKPNKNHCGVAINFNDINERKYDFLTELRKTVSSWVYSKAAQRKIFEERFQEPCNDLGNAAEHLSLLARKKFRKGHPQGQFGELLLFNFLQYFYGCPPLLRKMPITTSSSLERFGADAIHYSKQGANNYLFLGESKCYKSDYKFAYAFKDALASIDKTFSNLDSELDLYTYDDFIEDSLQDIAKKYKAGKLKNIHYELVCLIVYNENTKLKKEKEDQIKKDIVAILKDRCKKIDTAVFRGIESGVLSRMNYIFFPIWELDILLNEFEHGQ